MTSKSRKKEGEIYAIWKGDEFAAGTWVVVNELDDGNWGEGGSVLEAKDA
jgi:hypothetical protein